MNAPGRGSTSPGQPARHLTAHERPCTGNAGRTPLRKTASATLSSFSSVPILRRIAYAATQHSASPPESWRRGCSAQFTQKQSAPMRCHNAPRDHSSRRNKGARERDKQAQQRERNHLGNSKARDRATNRSQRRRFRTAGRNARRVAGKLGGKKKEKKVSRVRVLKSKHAREWRRTYTLLITKRNGGDSDK